MSINKETILDRDNDDCTLELSLSADSVEEMRAMLISIAENLEEIDKSVSGGGSSLSLRGGDRRH